MARNRSHRTVTGVACSALAVVASLAVLTGCGSRGTTALAIDDVRWHGSTSLLVTTECSTEVEAEVGPDHSGTGLPEVTVWGRPSVGTCQTSVVVNIPADTTRIVDGTTSMVLELPTPR